MKLIINTDGGARGNPGQGACGFVVREAAQDTFAKAAASRGAGNIQEKCGKYLGICTNNEAEYQAVIEALRWVKGKQGKIEEIIIKSDSLLLVSQMSGKWKIKDRALQTLVLEVKLIESQIGVKVRYMHVPRELNREADREVNRVLDEMQNANLPPACLAKHGGQAKAK